MMLPDRFQEPKGFRFGSFINKKGANIRFGILLPEERPRATVVIVTGFRECIEKYFELARDFQEKGYKVCLMDWRGQGGSERFVKSNLHKMHSEGYQEQIDTLDQFVKEVVGETEEPLILCAHSMGAHIGLRYIHDHPDAFDSAIMTSPMIDVPTAGIPRPVVRQLLKFAKAGGYLDKYVPGGQDYSKENEPFKGNERTSDPERYSVLETIYTINPKMPMGMATYGWLLHTLDSIDILQEEKFLKAIKPPILMGIAGDDKIVLNDATERAHKLLPHCTPVHVAGAKHEIWMEQDKFRAPFLQKALQFIEERLTAPKASPKKLQPHKVNKPPKLG